jgi:hypothetical protein
LDNHFNTYKRIGENNYERKFSKKVRKQQGTSCEVTRKERELRVNNQKLGEQDCEPRTLFKKHNSKRLSNLTRVQENL